MKEFGHYHYIEPSDEDHLVCADGGGGGGGGTLYEHESSPVDVRNFNDEVLVKITPRGEELWREYYEKLRETARPIGLAGQFTTPDIVRDEDGFTKLQLSKVAEIFGSAMHVGSHPPIETEFRFLDKPY